MRGHTPAFALLTALPIMIAFVGCDQQAAPGATTEDALNRVARSISRQEDRVMVAELADRLVQDRDQVVLLDLRDEAAFDAGHIEGARRAAITAILGAEGRADLPANRPLVLYAEDTAGAAQGAALLRLAGRDAYFLEGGYQAWQRHTAGPTGMPADVEQAHAMAKQQAVACYFAGDYVATTGLIVKAPARAAFVPPVEPVEAAGGADPLGLGLGSGLEPSTAEAPAEVADPLGLGLGSVPETGAAGETAPTPGAPPGADQVPGKLRVGEGC